MKNKRFYDRLLNMFESAILAALSIDLLYLYYNKAWYDPFQVIEIAEVILLYLILIFGISRLICMIKELSKGPRTIEQIGDDIYQALKDIQEEKKERLSDKALVADNLSRKLYTLGYRKIEEKEVKQPKEQKKE